MKVSPTFCIGPDLAASRTTHGGMHVSAERYSFSSSGHAIRVVSL